MCSAGALHSTLDWALYMGIFLEKGMLSQYSEKVFSVCIGNKLRWW